MQAAELREQAAWREGLVPYKVRLLAEYQRSSSEVLVVSGASRGAGPREGRRGLARGGGAGQESLGRAAVLTA